MDILKSTVRACLLLTAGILKVSLAISWTLWVLWYTPVLSLLTGLVSILAPLALQDGALSVITLKYPLLAQLFQKLAFLLVSTVE